MPKPKFQPLISESGRFSGYGAVFGNLDSHRDIIERGAFKTSLADWAARGKLPAMKLQHGSFGNALVHDDLPVGRWLDMYEDATGLWVEGELLCLDTDLGRRLKGLMTGSVLDALSIGYRVRDYRPGTGRVARYLTELALTEISLVDTPSNDLARVVPLSPTDMAAEKVRAALAAASAPGKSARPPDAGDRLVAALRNLR